MSGTPIQRRWLIWSIEHRAWWRANGIGYTHRRSEAGEYTTEEAKAIVANANHARRDDEPPQESMIEKGSL